MLALICGIISLVFGCIGFTGGLWAPIVGIVLAVIAIVTGKKEKEIDSKANAGYVLGVIGIILCIISLIVAIVLVAWLFSFAGTLTSFM
jgi:hypothetical protein